MDASGLLLITGATGLVGSHVAERARQRNIRTRALVRSPKAARLLADWGVELCAGDITEPVSLGTACEGVTHVVHCAAKVGDWGAVDGYRAVNVRGLQHLIEAVLRAGTVQRFVHVSSLGVYEGRDHFGTDESVPPDTRGMDGYTLTKVEAEQLVLRHVAENRLPAVVLRPGFIYGPRDRSVLPRLLERLRQQKVKYVGSGEQKLNNTYVGNLVDAIFLALDHSDAAGEVFNITDGRLVTKREFIATVAQLSGLPVPTRQVPQKVARVVAKASEFLYRLLRKSEAPLLSNARYKFMALNLEYSIEKARAKLGYAPAVDFTEAIRTTMSAGSLESR